MKDSSKYVWGVLRLLMGFTFFWPFFDKLVGLGFATKPEKAWLGGGSPTTGFLKGAHGPFASIFQGLSGMTMVDWLFMVGLLCIGTALILGIGVKIASWSGIVMLALMYLAALPPANNPVLDDHIIYMVVMFGFPMVKAGQYFGMGKQWSKSKLVKQFPVLE